MPAMTAGQGNSDTGGTVQMAQTPALPDRAPMAAPPILTLRTEGAPATMTPALQPTTVTASLAMDGEGAAKIVPLGEDSGKTGGSSSNSNSNSTATSTSTATNTATAASKAAAVSQQTATADVRAPGIQVAMQLSKAVQNGIDRLTIRLDPAELGKVEVKMEVGHDGRVMALVSAERPETLEALRQDSRALEKALQEAGLKTDEDSLNFSLNQGDGQGGALADDRNDGHQGGGTGAGDESGDGDEGASEDILPQIVSNHALDISV
jgi:flagellar hook-length control protein FliK